MFTGIIGEIGTIAGVVRTAGGRRLTINATQAASELAVNDSVAVNGVCLTVTDLAAPTFTVEAVEETLVKSTLGSLATASRVNLELPLRVGDRLGGHMVLGHVDCTGEIRGIRKLASSWMLEIAHPPEFGRYIIPVGSIAVDGISLTVAEKGGGSFKISVIPHTLEKTLLSEAAAGQLVNLEFDLLGKYVESLFGGMKENQGAGISIEKLREWGYGA